MSQLLTVDEVRQVLRCGRTTVHNLIKRGELTRVQVGRLLWFDPMDVAAYLDKSRTV